MAFSTLLCRSFWLGLAACMPNVAQHFRVKLILFCHLDSYILHNKDDGSMKLQACCLVRQVGLAVVDCRPCGWQLFRQHLTSCLENIKQNHEHLEYPSSLKALVFAWMAANWRNKAKACLRSEDVEHSRWLANVIDFAACNYIQEGLSESEILYKLSY